jgi:predicted nucleic acid-binding protein
VKDKRLARRVIELWKEKEVDIVDCYLVASLEGHPDHLLYSYDRDFDRFGIKRKEF